MSQKIKVRVQGIQPPGGDPSYWRDGYLIPVGEPIILQVEEETVRRWQTLPELLIEILRTSRPTQNAPGGTQSLARNPHKE